MSTLDLERSSVVTVDEASGSGLRLTVTVPLIDPRIAARLLSATVNPSPVHLARCELEDGTPLYPAGWSGHVDGATSDQPVRLVLWLRPRHRDHTIDGLTRHDVVGRITSALQELAASDDVPGRCP